MDVDEPETTKYLRYLKEQYSSFVENRDVRNQLLKHKKQRYEELFNIAAVLFYSNEPADMKDLLDFNEYMEEAKRVYLKLIKEADENISLCSDDEEQNVPAVTIRSNPIPWTMPRQIPQKTPYIIVPVYMPYPVPQDNQIATNSIVSTNMQHYSAGPWSTQTNVNNSNYHQNHQRSQGNQVAGPSHSNFGPPQNRFARHSNPPSFNNQNYQNRQHPRPSHNNFGPPRNQFTRHSNPPSFNNQNFQDRRYPGNSNTNSDSRQHQNYNRDPRQNRDPHQNPTQSSYNNTQVNETRETYPEWKRKNRNMNLDPNRREHVARYNNRESEENNGVRILSNVQLSGPSPKATHQHNTAQTSKANDGQTEKTGDRSPRLSEPGTSRQSTSSRPNDMSTKVSNQNNAIQNSNENVAQKEKDRNVLKPYSPKQPTNIKLNDPSPKTAIQNNSAPTAKVNGGQKEKAGKRISRWSEPSPSKQSTSSVPNNMFTEDANQKNNAQTSKKETNLKKGKTKDESSTCVPSSPKHSTGSQHIQPSPEVANQNNTKQASNENEAQRKKAKYLSKPCSSKQSVNIESFNAVNENNTAQTSTENTENESCRRVSGSPKQSTSNRPNNLSPKDASSDGDFLKYRTPKYSSSSQTSTDKEDINKKTGNKEFNCDKRNNSSKRKSVESSMEGSESKRQKDETKVSSSTPSVAQNDVAGSNAVPTSSTSNIEENFSNVKIKEEQMSDDEYYDDSKTNCTKSDVDEPQQDVINIKIKQEPRKRKESTSTDELNSVDIKEEMCDNEDAKSDDIDGKTDCTDVRDNDAISIVKRFIEACEDPNLLNLLIKSEPSLYQTKNEIMDNINNNNVEMDSNDKCTSWLRDMENYDRAVESPQNEQADSPDNPLNNDEHFEMLNDGISEEEEIVPYFPPSQMETLETKVMKQEKI